MKRSSILLLLLFCYISGLLSQVTVTGTINDDDGNTLPGVNIIEKGTQNGTASDINGTYTITVSSESSVLQYSFVGYLSEEIVVGSQTEINIVMIEDILKLDDLVVIGYGTAKKSDLTGAISSVKPKDLNLSASTNAAQMLQGRVAGLYIKSHDQNPGADPEFVLRGASSFQSGEAGQPLIVIDGFPMEEARSINTINPNDIEQIDVLKDASATSIYGSRGANGVIIITTKQGNKEGIQVDYSTKIFTQTHAKTIDMMDAQQYARFYYDLAHDPDLNISFNAPQGYPHEFSEWNNLSNTDWQKEVLNTGNLSQEHNLSLSGVKEGIKYRAAINYYNGEGIIAPSDYKRINTFAKLDYDYKKLSFNLNFNYTNENKNKGGFSSENRERDGNTYERALGFSPSSPIYDETGELSQHAFPGELRTWFYNPFLPKIAEENLQEINTIRISGGVEYEIIEGLRFSVKGGLTQSSDEDLYQRKKALYESDDETEGSYEIKNKRQIFSDIFLNYTKQFGKHKVVGLLGGSYFSYRNRGPRVSAVDFPYPNIAYYNINAGLKDRLPSSYWEEKVVASGLFRLNYDYANKYLVTFSYRHDGATVFGEKSKWGPFPSFGLAYRIDQENFFKDNVSFLDALKIKTGYGIAGNSNIPPFRTQKLIDFKAVHEGGGISNAITWLDDDSNRSDDIPGTLYIDNPKLHWEKTYTYNAGIEFGNKFFYAEINYYHTKHDELIYDRSVPRETGFEKITENKGSMLNHGLEGKLDLFLKFFNGDLRWNPSFIISFNKNKITGYEGEGSGYPGEGDYQLWIGTSLIDYVTYRTEGYPINGIWGYDFTGVWQENEREEALKYGAEPGDPKFADLNSTDILGNVIFGIPDSAINYADLKYLGDYNPGYTAGFTSQLNYKNFELNFFIEGVFDKSVLNLNKVLLTHPSHNYGTNKMTMALDRWTPTNPSNEVPALTSSINNNLVISDWAIEDASFIRMRDITLAYEYFPEKKKYINNIRIYTSISNVFTITKYTGLNPDVWGIDNVSNLIPFTRTYTLGLDVSF